MARESDFNWDDDLMTKWVNVWINILQYCMLLWDKYRYRWDKVQWFKCELISLVVRHGVKSSMLRANKKYTIKKSDQWSFTRSYQRQESHLAKLARSHGRDYGKPKPGSESEKRSIAYQVGYLDNVAYVAYQV